jgi:hypothetical protein
MPALEWNETEVAQKLGRWNWSATNKVTISFLSRPVDEKDKEAFENVAMLNVSCHALSTLRMLNFCDTDRVT